MKPGVSAKEQQLALELNQRIQQGLVKKRSRCAIAAALAFTASVVAFVVGQPMIAFLFVTASLICLLQYFDANGSLHDVRRRSTRRLMPDLSVLRREDSGSPVQKPSAT